jgi:hypothetical protein
MKMFFITGDIPTFKEEIYNVDRGINKKMFIYDGSVTDLECEVVVISANKKVSMKGEPCRYIPHGLMKAT